MAGAPRDAIARQLLPLLISALLCSSMADNGAIFHVRRRFPGIGLPSRGHESLRRARLLSAVDLPLGGLGLPSSAGLYFAQIAIGSPPKNYFVQIDTGSDLLWVNCAHCRRCPSKSDLGIRLSFYDPRSSNTARLVACDEEFCSVTCGNDLQGCSAGVLCDYTVTYGDGSATSGYFVSDHLLYDQVSGNNRTRQAIANITFGCSGQLSGSLRSSDSAVDGILGFGQSNSSMLSQLASRRKVRKIFSHCLDTVKGGGIFTIGQVVQPAVNTTPLVPNQPHYNVNMKAIKVGDRVLQLPSGIFDAGDKKGTVIDSGTTLAYLPDAAYKPLMATITSAQPNLTFQTVEDFLCIRHAKSVDNVFPVVTLFFENQLPLRVYPHDYLFSYNDNYMCFGWQNSGVQSKDGKDLFLLGDLVLSNKLVVYDLEKQTIGWAEHNCSSSIRVRDDQTGQTYTVTAHDISSMGTALTFCSSMGLVPVLLLALLV